MKKMLLILAALLCCCFALKAQDFTYENLNYHVTGTNPPTVELTGHTEGFTAHDFVIPSTVEDNDGTSYSVTSIGNYAFFNCSGFTGSLTIPNSVTSIGWVAFINCSGFNGSLTIGNAVTSIKEMAFAHCNFTHIIAKPATPPTLGNNVFDGMTESLTVTVPCGKENDYKDSWRVVADKITEGFVYVLTVASANPDFGTASITQQPDCGKRAEVIATPAEDHIFTNWTENGMEVSTNNPYTFTLTTDRNLVANFFKQYDFSAICETGQTLYYRIIDAEQHWVSIVAPNSDNYLECYEGYTRPAGNISLPATVSHNEISYTVKAIGDCAFYSCSGLTGFLTIPNSVTNIGEGAFERCSGFTGSLTIPNSVTNIGEAAFWNCSGFNGSLTIGSSVTNIGEGAFAWCQGFTDSLTIPNSVTNIGETAFFACSGFKGSLTIPNSVTSIGNQAFDGCSGFNGSLTIGSSVESIGNQAFEGCSSFTGSLTIGNSVTNIGGRAFYHCSGLNGSLTIGNSVSSIGQWAFGFTSFAQIIAKPATPPTLGSSALEYISDVQSIFVPCGSVNAYKSNWNNFANMIEGGSFEYELTAAPSSTQLGTASITQYSGCTTGLSTVVATPAENHIFTNWTENGMEVSTNNPYTFTLTTDRNLVANFCNQYDFSAPCTSGQTLYYRIIDEERNWVSIVAPNRDDFYECYTGYDKPTGNITLPETVEYGGTSYTVKEIGKYAFFCCDGLTGSLAIPNSVTNIEKYAFGRCSGFTGSLTIGSSVTSIGQQAFQNCTGFTGTLTIPNSVTRIGEGAFASCSHLTGPLIIPNSVTSIGICAFDGCSHLTGSLTIPNSVTNIGNWAFNNCSGFTGTLTIPNSVTRIGEGAFGRCSGFTGSLSIPNSVTSIGNYAFEGCSGFTGSLTIPNSVTSIGWVAFIDCSGFNGSLTIGSSVTNIGKEAFMHCNFTHIIAKPATPPTLGNNVFDGMTESLTVTVPCGKENDYKNRWRVVADKITEGFVYVLTVASANPDFGTASITQQPDCGKRAEVIATPAENHIFTNWTENGMEVSTNNPYTFTLTTDRNLVANFFKQYDFSATCTTGQTLYYRIIDAEQNLVSIVAPNGNNVNGWNGYNKPAGDITLPETVEYDGTSYTVTAIGDHSFNSCFGLTGTLNIPNSVTSIGNDAFFGCSGFSSLTIGNSVTSIGADAFGECYGLTGSLTIPNSVESIGEYAFTGLGYDGALTIGSSVTSIGGSAFAYTKFAHIISKPTTPPTLGTNAFSNMTELLSITVPCGKENDYKDSWSVVADKIDDGFVYELTVASANPEFGSASITQSATCENHQATVTATPAEISRFTGWTENGVQVSTDNPYTFSYESDHNLVANFESIYDYNPITSLPSSYDDVYVLGYQDGDDYYLHTSGTAAGEMKLSLNPANPVEYKFNDFGYAYNLVYAYCDNGDLSITTQGVSLSSFSPYSPTDPFALSITDGNISSAGSSGYTVCHNGNIITAHTGTSEGNLRFFKRIPLHYITLSVSPEETGTATATCGGEPVQSAVEGTEITVSATPTEDYRFKNWTENGEVASTENPYTFTLTADRNLVANFYKPYDFSAICETGQTLYYRIIDAEQHWVSIVAPNSDNYLECYEGYTRPAGNISLPATVSHNEISYTVKAIGDCAFYSCSGLTGFLTIPNSVTNIGEGAFEGCSGFTGSLTIPNSVTNIGEGAFEGCSGFKGSLTIPNSVTNIGEAAFFECSGFNGSLTIPNSVTSIGKEAFAWCQGFKGSLTIPNSVTNIGETAFFACSGFKGSLTIPNSVTSIGNQAFDGCSGFNGSLTIGSSVESIGNQAFEGCSGFTGSLTIGNSVTNIGIRAFYHCSGLNGSLTIGCSVTSIEQSAFNGCSFTNIISKAQTAPSLASIIPDASNKVYIPINTTNLYESAWSGHNYIFIEYNHEDYHFNGTGSEWNTAANWEENEVPFMPCHNVFVNADCIFDATGDNAALHSVNVAAGKTLTIPEGYTLTTSLITLENGAQLINNGTIACNDLTVKKDIEGYGTDGGNWYLVSSPVAATFLPEGTKANPAEDYDLYRFSQTGDSQGREWLNYKAESFGIENQSGYLYASKNGTTILFRGGLAATDAKTLTYDANADFAGFNLVGNPYPCNAYLANGRSFYRMNENGTEIIVDNLNSVIAPCEGVFVQAQGTGESITFTTSTTRNLPAASVALTLSQSRSAAAIDRAIVRLGEGDVLGKLMLNADGTRLYIPQDGKDFAVVSTSSTSGEMPLNFKAAKNGSYTITVNTENVDLNYLHLVDNLTGNDVNLMCSEEDVARNASTYTFDAKTDDYASRFKLVFGVKDAVSTGSAGNFAFISNGEIIVSNEGRANLQVIDVLGRIISSEEINGECRISTNGMTAGLYILNLNGTTQKIVVE